MANVNITINGQKLQAESGKTVLEVARANSIDIPVLCYHPALSPQGSCRLCLVEVEKQRALQPACTFPISEGMVVQTESEKVQASRKFVLELLFSERLHYCMYCPMSGGEALTECELQAQAYRHGLTNWKYAPNTSKRWPVDASRKYFLMDHSRCILCRRCIRACDEIVANHTLGVRDRGTRTMIIADGDVPFGESSCVSCGTCLQVCPTGALIDRRSAYMGLQTEVERTKSTCMACPVGCGIEAATRSNQLLRVEGDWDAHNGGLLCVDGRFAVVEPPTDRITVPMMRRDGELVKASWDEAATAIAQRLQSTGPAAGLASPRLPSESLSAFRRFFREVLGSDEVGLLYGELPPVDVGPFATLPELSAADGILLVGGAPLRDQKVVGYTIKRAVDQGTTLIVVNDTPTDLDPYATKSLKVADLAQATTALAPSERLVVVYAPGLAPEVYASLRNLPAKTRFLPLIQGTNTAGAARVGLTVRAVQGAGLFVMAGDDATDGRSLPAAEFTVVQAAYRSAWTEAADVVLPSRTWSERSGHIVNIEGRELPVVAFLEAPKGIKTDAATLDLLADRVVRPMREAAR